MADPETVVYVLFDPENFVAGELIGGVSVKRLKKAEFSVARGELTTVAQLKEKVVEPRLRNANLSFVGAVKAEAGAIRELLHTHEGERIFCVVDDPLLENGFLSHAFIRFSDATKEPYWRKNSATAALGSLLDAFSKSGAPLPIEQCCAAEAA